MKIWLDTEFMEDGERIVPLSIGAVREDGAEFYVEFEADYSLANDWVRANVLPHLDGTQHPRGFIAGSLIDFADPGGDRFGERPEFWGYYCDYDWVLLCQLYGRMVDLPRGWPKFCMDLKQELVRAGNPRLPEQAGTEHHALADARWIRDCWRWLHDQQS